MNCADCTSGCDWRTCECPHHIYAELEADYQREESRMVELGVYDMEDACRE
jgi:hypothetical protein